MEQGTRNKSAIVNIGLFLFLVVTLIFIAHSNVRDGNSLTIEYRFRDDGRVYGLYPNDRVSKPYKQHATNDKQQTFQELVGSPVYLDMRYWQSFNHARVEIEYKKDPSVDFQIGYKTGSDFQWKLITVPETEGVVFSGGDQFIRAVVDIDLIGEYAEHHNVHRWVFSSTNVQALQKAIRIYGITFMFTK